jgi:hypothetical protein
LAAESPWAEYHDVSGSPSIALVAGQPANSELAWMVTPRATSTALGLSVVTGGNASSDRWGRALARVVVVFVVVVVVVVGVGVLGLDAGVPPET